MGREGTASALVATATATAPCVSVTRSTLWPLASRAQKHLHLDCDRRSKRLEAPKRGPVEIARLRDGPSRNVLRRRLVADNPYRSSYVCRITPARVIFASMAGHVVIRITERLGGGEPLRTAYAVAEPNQHRAVALFKLRPDHTADEQVEAVVELTQSAVDSLGLRPGDD